MKIAYMVLKGMPFGGGIEKYTEEVGSRLVAKGHKVVVYAMRGYGAVDGLYRGMHIKTVPSLRARGMEKLSAAFVAALYQCMERDLDVVHFHAFGPAAFSFIPRLCNRKVVVQGHGLEWKRSRWGGAGRLFLKLTETPSVRFPHVLTVVSRVQQAYVQGRYGRQSVYIPTGVNPPKIEAPDEIKRYGLGGGDYILFAARLVREKGAHYLIDAYKRLDTPVKLVIAGDAPHEEAYKKELRDLAGGDGRIMFTGFVKGKLLDELFTNCRLFVLPSEIEGLPTALLEAMSYGNRCLTSDIPENLEALNGFGQTFRNKDAQDLSVRLRLLLADDAGTADSRELVKKYVLENFSWDDIAAQFEKLYEKMLH